jgi:threonylcarbamoyladenosine tRNA methylthiotransferase MtaB
MPTFHIQQFGCRATQADGAALERQLLDRGCANSLDPTGADIVVVNTCTVTAAADSQAREAIRKIHAGNPSARIIATGCYAQRAPEELANLPGVSWVVGNSHKPQIPDLVARLSPAPAVQSSEDFFPLTALHPGSTVPFHSFVDALNPDAPPASDSLVGAQHAAPQPPRLHPASVLVSNIFDRSDFLSAPVLGGENSHTRPTLKIQDGCNLRCSYCVIPFVRGKSRSLPPGNVIQEIRKLVSAGAKEIVLSGINLGTWGRDLSPRASFEDLLCRILDETSLDRLRLSSIEPQDVTQDLIELFAETDRLARHFHMPLQSGSDRILAAMHRWYRTEHYARRVELIRERLPHAAIGADVLVGFPGESESDHAATLAFLERLPFTYLHVFSFSARPGTQAVSLPDQVPAATIKRRARQLRALSEQKAASFRQSQQGRTLRVLTLNRAKNENTSTPALSTNYLSVAVSGYFPANLWLDVTISDQKGHCACESRLAINTAHASEAWRVVSS